MLQLIWLPFVDLNNNGIYEPQLGEYPKIKGDEMLWRVYNDNGPVHTETNGTPLQVEVHSSIYAYNRPGQQQLDDVIYFENVITNKSAVTYDSFRVGQFADFDLGYQYDDYIGVDTAYKMIFVYNGRDTDGSGQAYAYGAEVPMAGMMMLEVTTQAPAQSVPYGYMYYDNDYTAIGNPVTPVTYNSYIRAQSIYSAYDSGLYALPFAECMGGDLPFDKRTVLSTNNVKFAPGDIMKVAFALIATPPALNNGCPDATLGGIDTVADTAIYYYWHQLTSAVNNLALQSNSISLYPNPNNGSFTITSPGPSKGGVEWLQVFNTLGQVVYTKKLAGLTEAIHLDVTPGVYMAQLTDQDGSKNTLQLVVY